VSTLWLDLLGAQVRYRGRAFRTRTIEMGEEHEKKLILGHGGGGHAETYAKNLHELGKHYHVLAIDFLWHGLSEKPEFTKSMIPLFSRQIIDLIDDLGVDKASIEGESLGGWVALWTALHHPDRVDKIVLNTAAGVEFDRGKVNIDDIGGSNLLRDRSLAAIANPTRETVRKRLEWLMASPDRVTDELVELRYAFYTDPNTNAALANVFAHIFAHGPDTDRIPESALANVSVPALVLWSEKNPGKGPDAGERLASLIPDASYCCIKDAAHWPHWEQPAEHDRAVLAFLSGKQLQPTR